MRAQSSLSTSVETLSYIRNNKDLDHDVKAATRSGAQIGIEVLACKESV